MNENKNTKPEAPCFILVDDDSVSNFICKKTISKAIPDADIHEFTDPGTALEYIQSTYSQPEAYPAIVLLDINMPSLTGWEFLEAFHKFEITLKNKLNIYMLSSSVDPVDRTKAAKNPYVLNYFEKPITSEVVLGTTL